MIKAQDGLYTLVDRSVACKVRGDLIACTNDRVTIECDNDRCRAYRLEIGALEVQLSDAKAGEAQVLRPGTFLDFGHKTCVVEHTHLGCHLADDLGGFEMNALFARNRDFDDAPPGWPWDGRRYGPEHMLPGI